MHNSPIVSSHSYEHCNNILSFHVYCTGHIPRTLSFSTHRFRDLTSTVVQQAHPLRLWDACSGSLRCSYRSYNCKDEVTAPLSIACSRQGVCLVGLNRRIDVFDLACPGRECSTITTGQRGQGGDGQIGLISTLALNDHIEGAFAAGCYDGSVGVYDHRTLEQQLLLHGHDGGVTQVLWSRDGNYLYSAARRDTQVFCWDVRHVTGAVYCMQRDAAGTNQRIAVDIEPVGRHLVSGGQQGQVGMCVAVVVLLVCVVRVPLCIVVSIVQYRVTCTCMGKHSIILSLLHFSLFCASLYSFPTQSTLVPIHLCRLTCLTCATGHT